MFLDHDSTQSMSYPDASRENADPVTLQAPFLVLEGRVGVGMGATPDT